MPAGFRNKYKFNPRQNLDLVRRDPVIRESRRQELMERLQQIDSEHKPAREQGVVIAAFHGYLSGNPYLFSSQAQRAFVFINEAQAQAIIQDFGDVLEHPRIVRRNS